jgi:hypothetical protein
MIGRFFSLGDLIAARWRPRLVVLPWAMSAAVLSLLACWDVLARGAGLDFILLGLAGYELVIGLTESTAERPAGGRGYPSSRISRTLRASAVRVKGFCRKCISGRSRSVPTSG